MLGPVTTPVPLPARVTRTLNASGGGGVGGKGVGGAVTVMGREQAAIWSPLTTRTVESKTPALTNVCDGFGLVEEPPSPNVHSNS